MSFLNVLACSLNCILNQSISYPYYRVRLYNINKGLLEAIDGRWNDERIPSYFLRSNIHPEEIFWNTSSACSKHVATALKFLYILYSFIYTSLAMAAFISEIIDILPFEPLSFFTCLLIEYL